MKRAVWKYLLTPITNRGISVRMPRGAEVLSVQTQHGQPVLWAAVYPDSQLGDERRFHIIATGEEFDDEGMKYWGTFQIAGGQLVFHLYEKLTR